MSLEFTTSGEIFPKFTISTPEGSVDAKLLHSDQSVDTYSFTALKSGAYTLKFSSPAPQREGAYRFSAYSSCDLRKGPYYGNLDRDLDEPSLKSTTQSTQYFYAKDIEYCQGNGQLQVPIVLSQTINIKPDQWLYVQSPANSITLKDALGNTLAQTIKQTSAKRMRTPFTRTRWLTFFENTEEKTYTLTFEYNQADLALKFLEEGQPTYQVITKGFLTPKIFQTPPAIKQSHWKTSLI